MTHRVGDGVEVHVIGAIMTHCVQKSICDSPLRFLNMQTFLFPIQWGSVKGTYTKDCLKKRIKKTFTVFRCSERTFNERLEQFTT